MRSTTLLSLLIASYIGSPIEINISALSRREVNKSDNISLLGGIVNIDKNGSGGDEGAEASAQVEAPIPEKVELEATTNDIEHVKHRGLLGNLLDILYAKKQKAKAKEEEKEKAQKDEKGGIEVDAKLKNNDLADVKVAKNIETI